MSENHTKHYRKDRDGGCSVFINPTDEDDFIGIPGKDRVRIPAKSFLIIAGDFAHYGSNNYRILSGVYKFFFYVDPPTFNRQDKNNKFRDQVHLHNIHRLALRQTHTPFRVAEPASVVKYNCRGVNNNGQCCAADTSALHYSYPYCMTCLFHAGISVTSLVESSTKQHQGRVLEYEKISYKAFATKYLSSVHYVALPTLVYGNVLTAETYRICYPQFNGNLVRVIQLRCIREALGDAYENTITFQRNAVPSVVSIGEVIPSVVGGGATTEKYYLDYLSYCSFVGLLRQSNNRIECNLELLFDFKSSTGYLVKVKAINIGDELVLYNAVVLDNCGYELDYNAIMLNELSVGIKNVVFSHTESQFISTEEDISDYIMEEDYSGDSFSVENNRGKLQGVLLRYCFDLTYLFKYRGQRSRDG